MTIKLYGTSMSQPTRAVMFALYNTRTPFELVRIVPGSRKPGGSRHEDHLRRNPAGVVPTIEDGGFVLSESNAILTYLAKKYHWQALYPDSIEVQGRIDESMHAHHRSIRDITIALVTPILRPDLKLPQEWRDVHQKSALRALKMLNIALSSKKFIANTPQASLADIAAYCEIDQIAEFELLDLGPYPNIIRWMADMATLPGHDEAEKELKTFGARFRAKRQAEREASAKL